MSLDATMFESFLDVLSGRNKPLNRSLLKHGLFWISFSILFDYSTSWVMMALKGPMSEGNPIPRAFFEHRTVASLLILIDSQWTGIIFLLLGATTYFVATSELPKVSF